MKETIRVLEELGWCSNEMEAVISNLNLFEKISAELADLLSDTEKWSGESQEKCAQIHSLIQKYAAEILRICEQYRDEIALLKNNTDAFSSESLFIQNIRRM